MCFLCVAKICGIIVRQKESTSIGERSEPAMTSITILSVGHFQKMQRNRV